RVRPRGRLEGSPLATPGGERGPAALRDRRSDRAGDAAAARRPRKERVMRALAAAVLAITFFSAFAATPPKKAAAPAPKKALARAAKTVRVAFARAVQANRTVTALLGRYQAKGLKAFSSGTPADFAALAKTRPNFGELVKIDKILSEYNAAVEKGMALPGEKPPTELERCPADKACVAMCPAEDQACVAR